MYSSLNNTHCAERILFIADSRGRGLEGLLAHHLTNGFTVLSHGGATLHDSITKSSYQLQTMNWSQIYLLAGLCNLTHKNTNTKIVTLRYMDIDQAVCKYKEEILQKSRRSVCLYQPHPSEVHPSACNRNGLDVL